VREHRITFEHQKAPTEVNAYRVIHNQHRQKDLEERIKLDSSHKERLMADMEALASFVNAGSKARKLSYRQGLLLDKEIFRASREPVGHVSRVTLNHLRASASGREVERRSRSANVKAPKKAQTPFPIDYSPSEEGEFSSEEPPERQATAAKSEVAALKPGLRSRRLATEPMPRFFDEDDPPGREYRPILTSLMPPTWATDNEWTEWRENVEKLHGLNVPQDAVIPRTKGVPYAEGLSATVYSDAESPPAAATDSQWGQWLKEWHLSRAAKQHAAAQKRRSADNGLPGLSRPFSRRKPESPPRWARLVTQKVQKYPQA